MIKGRDDLLEFQNKFLQNNSTPCVKISKKNVKSENLDMDSIVTPNNETNTKENFENIAKNKYYGKDVIKLDIPLTNNNYTERKKNKSI
jgi:hypothetical protein